MKEGLACAFAAASKEFVCSLRGFIICSYNKLTKKDAKHEKDYIFHINSYTVGITFIS
jgi:hypothetical protein